MALRAFGNHLGNDGAHRQCHQSNQCHHRADGQHHNQNPDNGDYRGNQLRQALLQSGADGIDIVGNAAQNFPVLPGVIIA
ncbi:hypothetical protein D3C76_1196710 [compost metagenome]